MLKTSSMTARATIAAVAALLMTAGLMSGVSGAQQNDDNIVVIDGSTPSNQQITARLSRLTVSEARTVIVASSDNRSYADSLASAGLQDLGPLLVLDDIPAGRPIPDAVATELLRLDVERVLVLGGEAAVSQSTVDALEAAGYPTQRIAGPSRIETAVEVARVGAPSAETALIVRAFGSDEATDPTQGWVDALSSGPLALEQGAPILLTQQETLTGATAAYLQESQITDVIIIGGTAAVSSTVETQLLSLGYGVFRIAGTDRVDTALQINAARGVLDAPQRSIIVDGFADNGWVGGFASARHAVETRGAILPAQGDQLPPAVAALIQNNPVYEARPITCVVPLPACQEIDPDIAPEPTDTPTDTPTTGPTEPPEPVTDAVQLSSIPAEGSVIEPFVNLNLEAITEGAQDTCENDRGLDPDSEEYAECVDEIVDEILRAPLPPIDGTPAFVALELRLNDPLVELQNSVELSGDCITGGSFAIPQSFVRTGILDTRPSYYLGQQNAPEPIQPDIEEPVLMEDPSGVCRITVVSPLVVNDAEDEGVDFEESIEFQLDSYLANYRIATIPNAPTNQVIFENDSWGLDQRVNWDFGDGNFFPDETGSVETERYDRFVHTYDAPGEYEVTMTLTTASRGDDGQPNQTSISRIVEVE
ncbi:cell wall-binding repeat-containing protein [Euzebya tangerina]|uniref:cell wall-binding repeat-containing protein n=1 Tax=Euzebya tangerina TaxID=591198 RepID=UPI000E3104AA|nr:cell wall-binding repeat-containing protein [Euzebya tangerina]